MIRVSASVSMSSRYSADDALSVLTKASQRPAGDGRGALPPATRNWRRPPFAGRQKIVQLNHVCLSKGYEIGQAYAPAMAGR